MPLGLASPAQIAMEGQTIYLGTAVGVFNPAAMAPLTLDSEITRPEFLSKMRRM